MNKFQIISNLILLAPIANLSQAASLSAPALADGAWLNPGQSFEFQLIEDDEAIDGRLMFFIGNNDVTPLIQQTGIDTYSYSADILPLPSGSHTMTAYVVDNNDQWNNIGQLQLQVLTAAGFEQSEFTPRLEVTENSQFSSKARGDAFAPDPDKYHNVSYATGFSTSHTRNGWQINSNWNVMGTSVREQALRFGELQGDAPKADLSDYLVEVRKGNSNLSVGHVNFGNNPLLISGLANRGFTANYQAFNRLDISLTSQSGQSITGYNNLFGLKNRDQNSIQGASLGYDFLTGGPAQLRAEVTYLTAEVTSDLNFNFGEVADAEKNDGYGLVITGQNASGRVRANLSFARSTYINPEDPFLSQGFDIVPSLESTDSARSAQIDFDLVQPNYETNSNHSVTVSLHHDRTDALYKSVGAFLSPDTETNSMGIMGQTGSVSWQLDYRESRDNLDDLDTILTTVTQSKSLNLSIPLQTNSENPRAWLPQSFSYNAQHVHQFGDNLPVGFDPLSHIPDQESLLHNASLNWQAGRYSVGYNFSWSDQDNHQPGREQADFRDINHGLSLNLPFTDNFTTMLNLGAVSANDIEQNLKRYTESASISIDWRMGQSFSLSSNYSLSQSTDSEDFSENENYSMQTQLTYRFELPTFGRKKLPGQFFLRHSLNDNYSIDNQFQFESDGRSWSVHGGLNLSWF